MPETPELKTGVPVKITEPGIYIFQVPEYEPIEGFFYHGKQVYYRKDESCDQSKN